MNDFKQYMQNQYEQEELKEIAEHGCASCAPSGMIYYSETEALYHQYAEDLHDILNEHIENTGDYPKCIQDSLGDFTQFANVMVWFCAELVAYELTE